MNARTLRQIVGVPASLHAGATLVAAKTAVVLIDYQNEYRSGPLALPDEPTASKAARQLRAWADRAGIAVIHVLHRAPATARLSSPRIPESAAPHRRVGCRPRARRSSTNTCPRPSPAPGWLDVLQARGSRNAAHRRLHDPQLRRLNRPRSLPSRLSGRRCGRRQRHPRPAGSGWQNHAGCDSARRRTRRPGRQDRGNH
jgi:nicotinamidase-related amidase